MTLSGLRVGAVLEEKTTGAAGQRGERGGLEETANLVALTTISTAQRSHSLFKRRITMTEDPSPWRLRVRITGANFFLSQQLSLLKNTYKSTGDMTPPHIMLQM